MSKGFKIGDTIVLFNYNSQVEAEQRMFVLTVHKEGNRMFTYEMYDPINKEIWNSHSEEEIKNVRMILTEKRIL